MSVTEILSIAQALSRREKYQLVQLLLANLAGEEPAPLFPEGQVYPIHTPPYAPGAATQLAAVLAEQQVNRQGSPNSSRTATRLPAVWT